MANIEDLKKVAEENGVELTDEMLENVAGGEIPTEIWTQMTEEERKQAQIQSMLNIAQGKACELQ